MTLDPIAAELHGWHVVEQAERLLAEAGPQGGEYRASMRAKAEALCLSDSLYGFGSLHCDNPEAYRVQINFWLDVYREILERAHA